ncbi:MAG: CBS domain-containing protein [Alphaproteobacteria bacterium]|nr:CBS domain-containing protein [Alphaproteobacteria bacterium]
MRRTLVAMAIGLLAAAILAAAYLLAPRAGLRIDGTQALVLAAILAFGSAVAVFSLVALDRPGRLAPYQKLRLNEMPAAHSVSLFKDDDKIFIPAKPDQSLSEILVRFGDTFDKPSKHVDKRIVVSLRGGRTDFNPVILKALFAALAPFKVEHVILVNSGGKFVACIPGDRAKKEFSDKNGETRISECVNAVLKNPSAETSIACLRSMGGITTSELIEESDDIRHAARKVYANTAISGLVVHKGLEPIGVISKTDILLLASSDAFNAGVI